MTVELHFYTRPGCGLCDVAWNALEPVATELGVPIQRVDIDSDPVLLERFRTKIPVVTIDGNAVFTYRVDPELARTLLQRAIARNAG